MPRSLFHKIRDVMRRLRLAAPSITERAANLDCNTVAEYLDNALPADRVPDFEEVSLKSEMHLAEVASCHQILTMVLGEPAEIDPASRQRMYQLPTVANRVDEERLAAVEAASMLSGDGNAAVPPVLPLKVRPRPVVPEYLRDPPKKSRLLLAAAIMLFVGATVGLVWLTVYPNSWQWVQAKLHGNPTEDEKPDIVKKGLKESGESDAAQERQGELPSPAIRRPCAGQRIRRPRRWQRQRQSFGNRRQERGSGSGPRATPGETGSGSEYTNFAAGHYRAARKRGNDATSAGTQARRR